MENSKSYIVKSLCLRSAPLTAVLLVLSCGLLMAPSTSQAQSLKQCVNKLGQCAEDALKVVGQSLLTVGHLAVNITANADCLAAMASGNPGAIGVTGLVLGLGAAGVVNPKACDADIYGVAAIPIAEGVDAVVGGSLAQTIKTTAKAEVAGVARSALELVIVPGALPPTAAQLISCGCGALEAGAQALEDVRKVAKFAAAAGASCGDAIDACPGLRQIAAAGKAIYGTFERAFAGDFACAVQSSKALSGQQYSDAYFRPRLPKMVEFVRKNEPWAGSPGDQLYVALQGECVTYYSKHCKTDDEAGAICREGPIALFDPELWVGIATELNGVPFDQYFAANFEKLAPAAACPKPPGSSVNLNPNAIPSAAQIRQANAMACSQEMNELRNGKDNQKGLKSLARDLLPTTREGWVNALGAPGDKPLPKAQIAYQRALTGAAVVIKARMEQVSQKYKMQDDALQNSNERATAYLEILNPAYGAWVAIRSAQNIDKCPADKNGFLKKYDFQCAKEFYASLGFELNAAASTNAGDLGTIVTAQSLVYGNYSKTRYYQKATEIMLSPISQPRIRVPGQTPEQLLEGDYSFYKGRLPTMQDALVTMLNADMPSFFAGQHERVTSLKLKRDQQEQTLKALFDNMLAERGNAATVCGSKLPTITPKAQECVNKIYALSDKELERWAAFREIAYAGITGDNTPTTGTKIEVAATSMNNAHRQTMLNYSLVHKEFNAIPLVAVSLKPAVGVVGAGVNLVQDKLRGAQDAQIKALEERNNRVEQLALATCGEAARVDRKIACAKDITTLAKQEDAAFAGFVEALFGKPPQNKGVASDTNLATAIASIDKWHKETLRNNRDVHEKYGLSPSVSKDDRTPVAKASPDGSVAILKDAAVVQAVVPEKAAPRNFGMPGLPQMIRALPPPVNKIPPAADPGSTNPSKAAAAVVAANSPPAAGLGTTAVIKEELLKPSTALTAATGPATATPATVAPATVAAAAAIAPPTSAAVATLNPANLATNLGSALPFDAVSYRKERDKSLADEWFAKCINQPNCLQKMSGIATKRIDAEIMQLKSGPPDFRNKAAVAVFQDSLDGLYDPQFKAAIPAIVANTPPATGAGAAPLSNQKNPLLIKRLP